MKITNRAFFKIALSAIGITTTVMAWSRACRGRFVEFDHQMATEEVECSTSKLVYCSCVVRATMVDFGGTSVKTNRLMVYGLNSLSQVLCSAEEVAAYPGGDYFIETVMSNNGIDINGCGLTE